MRKTIKEKLFEIWFCEEQGIIAYNFDDYTCILYTPPDDFQLCVCAYGQEEVNMIPLRIENMRQLKTFISIIEL